MAVRVLGGRYELVAFVGRGGMGEVWEGRDRVIERRVAVKLLPHDRRDASGAELFLREARTAGGLNHAGVVTVFDLGQDPDDGTLYLVMEFLTGRDLDTVLRQDGPPEVSAAVEWAAQTAGALEVAHTAGVVHRDLKPANLMLGPDGRVKILDFGIARYMASTNRSSKVIGTLAYMSPERFGELPGDARSDLYSLGCVLHELLTGHTPFRAGDMIAMMAAHLHATPAPPGGLRPGVPAALDDLVLALLAKDPDHRPASAAEVHRRLRELPTTATTHHTGNGPSGADTKATPPTDAAATAAGTTVPREHAPHEHPTATARTPESVPVPAADIPLPRRLTRRTALRLGIGATAAAAVPAALTLFDRDTRDIRDPGAGLDAPRVRWRIAIGNSDIGPPTVVAGVVYIGSGDNVSALDAATGTTKWTYPATGTQPTVVDGTVYASRGGDVHAVDATTGAKQWTFSSTALPIRLAVNAGTAYVISDRQVYALATATGAKSWVFDSPVLVTSSPTVANGVVYIYGNDYNLYARTAETGAAKWNSYAGSQNISSPAVVDGVVYFGGGAGSDAYACAWDAATGTKRWAFTTAGVVYSSPAVVDGVAYFGSADCKVYALDAATGTKRWAFTTGATVYSSPAVVDGTVYFGSNDNKVYALDAATGTKRWAFTTGAGVAVSPAVVDGVVYMRSDDGYVYALNAATGAGIWAFEADKRPKREPRVFHDLAVADGTVYVSATDGSVYALDAAKVNSA